VQEEILAHWPTVSRLLDEALDLDMDARRSWLDSLPSEHESLRPLIARLLARHAEAAVVPDILPQITAPYADSGPRAGAQIGPYRLRSLIGRGGMGTVWLAEAVEGGARLLPVAVKLPSLEGQSTQAISERFERERQILAALNHPNIARLYEAGVSAGGQPYLALEYVEGEPLPAYCNRHALGVRKRLELFLQVLKAVQYAHASLVIHRDLKPSNIIATSTADVKLLDFGIAKLLDRETQRTTETRLTLLYGQLMTLDYASPEQVRGEPLGTASDVYSLGVVLYELLTGARPYRLKRGSRAELEEAILTIDTARPSQAIGAEFAASLSVPVARWRRTLRGDLDTIVLKALEKDRTARYQTAEAFAQECERYLQHLPVLAQPQSRRYRIRKFLGRHRLAFGAATAVVLALLVGLGTALWQARVALVQSQVAQDEARKQRAVQSFLTALFDKNTRQQADAARARAMTVPELLLDASERVQVAFGDTPTVKLELLNTVASLLRDIDEYERAATLSDQAVALAKSHDLTAGEAYVEALMGQATAARLLGRGERAVLAREAALAVLDAREDHTSLLRARVNANTVAQFASDPEREIALVAQGVQLFEQRYASHPAYFQALYYLANLYRTSQRPFEAEAHFRRAIAVFERTGSRDYTNLGASYGFAGECGMWLGHVQAALNDYARALEILDRHAGSASLVARFQRAQYIEALSHAGRLTEARNVMNALVQTLPAQAQPTVADFDATVYQAFALLDAGSGREAQQALEPFSDSWLQFGKRYGPNGGRWVVELAYAQALQGESARAHETLQRMAELPSHYGTALESSPEYVAEAAWIELASGNTDTAARVLERAADALREMPKLFSWAHVRLRMQAAQVALARGEPKRAFDYADTALSHLRAHADAGGFPLLEARVLAARGQALLALEKASEARADLEAAMAIMRRLHSPASPWRLDAAASLARAYGAEHDLLRARTLLGEARAIARLNPALAPLFRAHLEQAEKALSGL
jgi:serine/threonine protein kinase